MRPNGTTYWLDETYLDFGNDDYYNMPARHLVGRAGLDVAQALNAPTYTLTVAGGTGVVSTASDLPGVDCAAGAPCTSTWDANTT